MSRTRKAIFNRTTCPDVEHNASVVVLKPEVGDEVCAHDVTQGVLELHRLDEEIVLGVEAFGGLR